MNVNSFWDKYSFQEKTHFIGNSSMISTFLVKASDISSDVTN